MYSKPLQHQQGAATILMSVLVGFSITAMGLALMFNINSAQNKQISAQAQVNAQSTAWAGGEAFRQVLEVMPTAELEQLQPGAEFRHPPEDRKIRWCQRLLVACKRWRHPLIACS